MIDLKFFLGDARGWMRSILGAPPLEMIRIMKSGDGDHIWISILVRGNSGPQEVAWIPLDIFIQICSNTLSALGWTVVPPETQEVKHG